MDIGKINADIVKAIYKGNRVVAYHEGENTIFITTDGVSGFWLTKGQILFNISKVQIAEKKLFDVNDFVSVFQEIIPTDDYRKVGNKFIRKFKSKCTVHVEPWTVWIDSDLLKPITKENGVHFYQRFIGGNPAPAQPIIAVQEFTLKKMIGADEVERRPLMIYMPMRVYEQEG